MMKKAESALLQAFLRARLAVMKFEQEERGDAVQTIIVIAVGVIIAGILYKVLTGNNQNGEGGLIGDIFNSIKTKMSDIFGDSWKPLNGTSSNS